MSALSCSHPRDWNLFWKDLAPVCIQVSHIPPNFSSTFFLISIQVSILSNKKTRSKYTVSILLKQISQILISFTLKFTLWFQVDEFTIYWALYAKTWGELNTKASKNLKVHVFFRTRLCKVYTKTRRK